MDKEGLSWVEVWATLGLIVVLFTVILMFTYSFQTSITSNTEHQIYVRCLETQVLEPDGCRVLVYGEEE